MFRRLTWMSVGLVAGFGASKWLERKARRYIARFLPASPSPLKAGVEVADRARVLAADTLTDLRAAVGEGRAAMVTREAQLRRQLRLPDPAPDRRVDPGQADLGPVGLGPVGLGPVGLGQADLGPAGRRQVGRRQVGLGTPRRDAERKR